ncbi:hypothetical protein [Pantoea ananatis]|uniref:hypothetical protein n=1 Tax=Pantoea ananas TaxID=553 RepID=UPI0025C8F963|nr:hypothetical protein [Pantoea ananatis]MDN4131867.1 hypothetical protein [Pantoea ananatis]
MINIDDIKAGYTLGHADAEILRSMAKELQAYRRAFSEPVAFTAMSNVNELSRGVSYMWRPGNEKPTDVALYRKPTIPE